MVIKDTIFVDDKLTAKAGKFTSLKILFLRVWLLLSHCIYGIN